MQMHMWRCARGDADERDAYVEVDRNEMVCVDAYIGMRKRAIHLWRCVEERCVCGVAYVEVQKNRDAHVEVHRREMHIWRCIWQRQVCGDAQVRGEYVELRTWICI